MTQTHGNLQSWQQDIEKWKTDLAFCRDEVKILDRYLGDVNEKMLSPDMKEDIAHFKTRLSETREKSEIMIHELSGYANTLISTQFNEENVEMHSAMKERTSAFCKSYLALKSSFVRFLAKSELLIS